MAGRRMQELVAESRQNLHHWKSSAWYAGWTGDLLQVQSIV